MNINGNWMNFAYMDISRLYGSGNAIQHLHYLPFGEDWVDQRNSSWNTPFTFSGKEKDAETGYGYFGARYYDSGMSIWLSVDPMSDKCPSMSPYNYCANNPLILVDPDGNFPFDVHSQIVNEAISSKSYYFTPIRKNIVTGAGYVADFGNMSNSMVHLDNMNGYASIATAYNNAASSFKTNFDKGAFKDAGVSLHTVADFYAHSNYIELYQQYANENGLSMEINDIPTFTQAQNDPKLVNYLKENNLRTGTYGDGTFAYLEDKFSSDKMSHGQTNKDTESSPAGKIKYNKNATMYDAAIAVAKKETQIIVDKNN